MREAKVKAHVLKAYRTINGPETPLQRMRREREKPAQTYKRQERQIEKLIDSLEAALIELGVPVGKW